jgi:hypothetical protein
VELSKYISDENKNCHKKKSIFLELKIPNRLKSKKGDLKFQSENLKGPKYNNQKSPKFEEIQKIP